MKRLFFSFLCMALMAVPMMASVADDSKTVSYVLLKNYFHNNDAPIPTTPMIKTQQEFDAQFGMAASMGEDGQPTPVDFKKQVVIAIVLPETNVATTIDSVVITQPERLRLQVNCIVRQGDKQSYTTQPIYLMAIDRKYSNCAVSLRQRVRRKQQYMAPTYTFVSYKDADNHLSLSADYSFSGPQEAVNAGRGFVRQQLLNVLAFFSPDQKADGSFYPYSPNEGDQLLAAFGARIVRQMAVSNAAANAAADVRSEAMLKVHKVDESDSYVTFESMSFCYSAGAAHGLSGINGVTFDKQTGKAVNLVVESDALRSLLTKRLKEENPGLELQIDGNVVPMPAVAPYLVDGKVVFQYQPYEIAAYAAGAPRVELWLNELDGMLTSEAAALK